MTGDRLAAYGSSLSRWAVYRFCLLSLALDLRKGIWRQTQGLVRTGCSLAKHCRRAGKSTADVLSMSLLVVSLTSLLHSESMTLISSSAAPVASRMASIFLSSKSSLPFSFVEAVLPEPLRARAAMLGPALCNVWCRGATICPARLQLWSSSLRLETPWCIGS